MQIIIDNSNAHEAITERLDRLHIVRPFRDPDSEAYQNQRHPGCIPEPYTARNHPFALRLSDVLPAIPRSEWPGLIAARKTRTLRELIRGKLPPHDQGRTNYCWAHGCVRADEITYALTTGRFELRSAESIAVPVTGGRNRGGYASEALARLISHGACPQEFWPLNDLNERNAKPGWIEAAALRQTVRWAKVESFEMQMTCHHLGLPVPTGLGWWSHLICLHTAIHYGGTDFGIGGDNSWGATYGDNGYFELHESKATGDLGCYVPLTQECLDIIAGKTVDHVVRLAYEPNPIFRSYGLS